MDRKTSKSQKSTHNEAALAQSNTLKPQISSKTSHLLTDQQRLNWLRLIRTPAIGSSLFRRAINHFGSSQGAVDNLEEFARFVGRKKPLVLTPQDEALKEIEKIEKFGAKLVAQGEHGYPPLINHIDLPPPLLTIKGEGELAHKRIISAVGARNASALGKNYTHEICTKLAQSDFAICSGLARGIDRAAHDAALSFGTIAVIAGGINHIYPKEHATLLDQICNQGLLISERPFGYIPKAKDFPRRNRLIAGCCELLIVFEAALRSGSLVSARLAVEQSRYVFAVPGHPKDPRAAGTNYLIKNGATPLDDVKDIFETLEASTLYNKDRNTTTNQDILIIEQKAVAAYGVSRCTQKPDFAEPHINSLKEQPLIPRQKLDQLLGQLSHTPISTDVLTRQLGISSQEMQSALLELSLSDEIVLHGAGLISVK